MLTLCYSLFHHVTSLTKLMYLNTFVLLLTSYDHHRRLKKSHVYQTNVWQNWMNKWVVVEHHSFFHSREIYNCWQVLEYMYLLQPCYYILQLLTYLHNVFMLKWSKCRLFYFLSCKRNLPVSISRSALDRIIRSFNQSGSSKASSDVSSRKAEGGLFFSGNHVSSNSL